MCNLRSRHKFPYNPNGTRIVFLQYLHTYLEFSMEKFMPNFESVTRGGPIFTYHVMEMDIPDLSVMTVAARTKSKQKIGILLCLRLRMMSCASP